MNIQQKCYKFVSRSLRRQHSAPCPESVANVRVYVVGDSRLNVRVTGGSGMTGVGGEEETPTEVSAGSCDQRTGAFTWASPISTGHLCRHTMKRGHIGPNLMPNWKPIPARFQLPVFPG